MGYPKSIAAAYELPPKKRGKLASDLIRSLDEGREDKNAAALWDKEIVRRVQEIRSGKVELIPWEKVKKELQPKSKSRRGSRSRG